jgi:hypothetical protein
LDVRPGSGHPLAETLTNTCLKQKCAPETARIFVLSV